MKFHILADGTYVLLFFLFVLYLIIFVLVYPIYSKFWLCDYCYREMKKCQCYLIYEIANGM